MATTDRDTGYLEFAARALPVIGALLPATGLGVRWLAFYLSGIQPRLRVVSSLSLTELSILGFQSMLDYVVAILLLGFVLKSLEPLFQTLVRARSICRRVLEGLLRDYPNHVDIWKAQALHQRFSRFPEGRVSTQFVLSLRAVERELAGSGSPELEALGREIEEVRPRWLGRTRVDTLRSEPRRTALFPLVFLAVPLAVIIFFSREFPTILLLLIFAGVGLIMVDRAIEQQVALTLARAAPAIAIFLTGGVFSQAVHWGTDAASHYNFTEGSELQDGYYVEIGSSGSDIYLLSCGHDEKVVRTRAEFSISATSGDAEPAKRASLAEILFTSDSLELGLNPACPREAGR